jgi:hypothetical protein
MAAAVQRSAIEGELQRFTLRVPNCPDLVEATRFRMTRVVLAAAHLDGDPTNRMKSLRALCQRCHTLHDRPHHLAQRWITYRRGLAAGDLFLGPYPALIPHCTGNASGHFSHSTASFWRASAVPRSRSIRYGDVMPALTLRNGLHKTWVAPLPG